MPFTIYLEAGCERDRQRWIADAAGTGSGWLRKASEAVSKRELSRELPGQDSPLNTHVSTIGISIDAWSSGTGASLPHRSPLDPNGAWTGQIVRNQFWVIARSHCAAARWSVWMVVRALASGGHETTSRE
jgi:hypothetical protein